MLLLSRPAKTAPSQKVNTNSIGATREDPKDHHETAIDYFWKIQQLAALRGQIPEALGFWLWHNLKEGSTVQIWFATLPPVHQDYMRTNWLMWLNGIKEGYLGRTWQLRMNKKYESQSFRQFGHKNKTPAAFIARRIMYTRMLV